MELGGKSPYIVFEDADIDGAIEGLVDAIWFNQGQVCCAGSRLLVQEGIAENFIARLRARMDKLRVGHPLDKAVDMGAIVDKVQLERIESLVKQGVAEGAVCYQSPARFLRQGLLLSADFAHQCASGFDGRARGDFRARSGGDDLPHAG